MADTPDSNPGAERREGSSPSFPTEVATMTIGEGNIRLDIFHQKYGGNYSTTIVGNFIVGVWSSGLAFVGYLLDFQFAKRYGKE